MCTSTLLLISRASASSTAETSEAMASRSLSRPTEDADGVSSASGGQALESTAQTENIARSPTDAELTRTKTGNTHPGWAVAESKSLYPHWTATSPEVSLWAAAKGILRDGHRIISAARKGVVENDIPRIASCLSRAYPHAYKLPKDGGFRYPLMAKGYKAVRRCRIPEELYPRGAKGLKEVGDGDVPMVPASPIGMSKYLAAGRRQSGHIFVPQPSRLNQVETLEYDEAAVYARGAQEEKVGMNDGGLPPPIAGEASGEYWGPAREYHGNISDSDSDTDSDPDADTDSESESDAEKDISESRFTGVGGDFTGTGTNAVDSSGMPSQERDNHNGGEGSGLIEIPGQRESRRRRLARALLKVVRRNGSS